MRDQAHPTLNCKCAQITLTDMQSHVEGNTSSLKL